MEAVLLIDFGSTYTKVTAVDVTESRLLGTAAAYTTVETDVGEGLSAALAKLEQITGKVTYQKRLACSSAAGGLRMVAIGLVPELTAKAARLATLGAGAKLIGSYSYQLNEDDIAEIDVLKPDIVLLTGGIDGGNSEAILHNARMLSGCRTDFPVVVAGNRSCARQVAKLLEPKTSYIVENVMPKLNRLNILPAQRQIRELFLEQIIRAKGLSREAALVDGILMPTPAAVLTAVELLAKGCPGHPGIGELICVDLGGATTDVYSIASGAPRRDTTVYKGLPEPYAKRTVEGDIGMRYSVQGIAEAAGYPRLAQLAKLPEEKARELVEYLAAHTDSLPDTPELDQMDFALASLAIETAVARHCGTMEEVFTLAGTALAQTGKDLTGVERLVLTGGALIHAKNVKEIAAHALYSARQPESLRPMQAEVLVDQSYILAAMGLLAGHHPISALNVMKKELVSHGFAQSKNR